MVKSHCSLKAIQILVMDQDVHQEIHSILDNRFVDSLILVDDLLAKALQSLATCVSVNNHLRGKLVSSLGLPIIFDDFDLLSYEFDSFTFKLLYWVMLY